MTDNAITLFTLLLVGHIVCDYPLQGDFLARAKNHRNPVAGVPWMHALLAHASMHGMAVAVITGMPILGWAECAVHAGIDWLKCDGRFNFHTDQMLHWAFKLLWVSLVVYA